MRIILLIISLMLCSVRLSAQQTTEKFTIEERKVKNTTDLEPAMQAVEEAIRSGNTAEAYKWFTPEAYHDFKEFVESGQPKLTTIEEGSDTSGHHFSDGGTYLRTAIAYIVINNKRGATFTERLVCHFDVETRKIIGLGLAVHDIDWQSIMKAQATWPYEARWKILRFLETYRMAYTLKRMNFFHKLFDNALMMPTDTLAGVMKHLERAFTWRGLTIADVGSLSVKSVPMPPIPSLENAAFAIAFQQKLHSSLGIDNSYPAMLLDVRKDFPVVYVCLWQADNEKKMDFQEFYNTIEKFE